MPTDKRKGHARKQKPAYDEITVDSWQRFNQTVLSRRYNGWAFRGHANADWPLQSTLARRFENAKVVKPEAWVIQERRILRIFQRKAHLFIDHIPDGGDTFRWLALMQHHGAPTRLLDFTWSPYVAAFFALENAADDAAIWAVNTQAMNSAVLTLDVGGLRQNVTGEDLGPWQHGNFERYFLGNEHSFVVYGEPHIMNQRLIAQSGTFVIPSTHAEPVEDILSHYARPKKMLVKFVLRTRALRREAMLALYSMNITYYTLFPGLDGLARSLSYEAEYNWSYDLYDDEAAAARRPPSRRRARAV